MTLRNLIKRLLLAPFAVFRKHQAGGRIALTFDDGPHSLHTAQVSAILKECGARATFFLVGENMLRYPALVNRLREDGHELASHSMTHPEMSSLGLRQLADEVDKMYTLTLPDGSIPLRNRLFRPPKGVVTLPLVWHCARKGIQLVFWNRDPEDYKAQGSYEILDYFKADLPQSGDIILLHDKTTHIVAALPQLLAQLRNLGLKPVTVSELLA